jgi:hypothetical protein
MGWQTLEPEFQTMCDQVAESLAVGKATITRSSTQFDDGKTISVLRRHSRALSLSVGATAVGGCTHSCVLDGDASYFSCT